MHHIGVGPSRQHAGQLDPPVDRQLDRRRVGIAHGHALADPQALVIANAAAQAVQFVGWPEGRIILSEAVIYVACAPKSNSAYMAIDAALADVRHKDCGDVPDYLRDSHYSGAAALGHGLTYQYPHDFDGGWVAQQYLPDALKGASYYRERPYGQEGSMAAAWHKRRGGK